MPGLNSITRAVAATIAAAALQGPLYAQVTDSQDSAGTPWPTTRVPGRFPGTGGTPADTGTATTSPGTNPSTATVVAADAAGIRQVIGANTLEVRLGQMAESRAGDDEVEDFAERMVTDHSAMSRQWEALARANRVTLTLDTSSTDARTIERLEDLSGDDFDRAYMTEMIRRHEQDLAALERMATSARSVEVRRLAGNGVTTVREHLALAREVGRGAGVSTVANKDRDDRDRDDRDRDDRELRGTDRAFVMKVLADHRMHIRLAERAQRQATSGETRRFAKQMEEDFTRWQRRWSEVASRYDVKEPKGLDRAHGQKLERLQGASKESVDRAYAAIVADHLAALVSDFQKDGRRAGVPGVRRLVDDELPLLREHLERARRLERQWNARAERSERE